MPVIPKYRLIYFDLEGRAEVSRLLFKEAGVEFDDHRIGFDKWPELKPTTPFGQLPVLELDGKPLAQSDAINRLLARQFGTRISSGGKFLAGFYGADDWESAKIDEIVAAVNEEASKLVTVALETDETKKMLETVVKPLLTRLQLQLGDRLWLVGTRLSLADIKVFHIIYNLQHNERFPTTAARQFDLDEFPHIAELVQRVTERPNIKAYIAQKLKTARGRTPH